MFSPETAPTLPSPIPPAPMAAMLSFSLAWKLKAVRLSQISRPAPAAVAQRSSAGRSKEEPIDIAGLEFDEALHEKLRQCRTRIAEEEGVPAYVVFNNQTLEFFTRLKPQSVDAGAKIRGVGEKKAERFLPAFIEVIREYEGE